MTKLPDTPEAQRQTAPLAVAPCSAFEPPQTLWVRFGEERSIIGQWDFEPFPPGMCAEMNVIKYVRDSSPNTMMSHAAPDISTPDGQSSALALAHC